MTSDARALARRAIQRTMLRAVTRRALGDAEQLEALVDIILTYYPPDNPLRLEVEHIVKRGATDES